MLLHGGDILNDTDEELWISNGILKVTLNIDLCCVNEVYVYTHDDESNIIENVKKLLYNKMLWTEQ